MSSKEMLPNITLLFFMGWSEQTTVFCNNGNVFWKEEWAEGKTPQMRPGWIQQSPCWDDKVTLYPWWETSSPLIPISSQTQTALFHKTMAVLRDDLIWTGHCYLGLHQPASSRTQSSSDREGGKHRWQSLTVSSPILFNETKSSVDKSMGDSPQSALLWTDSNVCHKWHNNTDENFFLFFILD